MSEKLFDVTDAPPFTDLPASRPRHSGFAMPLLVRELLEQAARKRTWVIRSVYAALLYLLLLLPLYIIDHLSPAEVLGAGEILFSLLVLVQMLGIAVFLPAMMAGVITSEKESNTLELLLVSGLSPRAIVLEKLCSQLVPMLSFLLLGAPLLALVYAYGGVKAEDLWVAAYLLLLTCIHVGAVSLACSAFCRSTLAALVSSYGLISVIYGFSWFGHSSLNLPQLYWRYSTGGLKQGAPLVWVAFWVGITIAVCYLVAVWGLKVRALRPSRNILQAIFGRIDSFMNEMNSLTGDIVIAGDSDHMLETMPVAWREMTRQSLGRARYLFRVLVALGTPVLVAFVYAVDMRKPMVLGVTAMVLWCLAVIVVALAGVNTIARERLGQTMEVLLTTTMFGSEIIAQKMTAIRRLYVMIGLVLLGLSAGQALCRTVLPTNAFDVLGYLVVAVAAVCIYLPLVARIGCWLGLRIRSRTRAAITTLGLIMASCILPALVIVGLQIGPMSKAKDVASLCQLLSPVAMLVANELPVEEFYLGSPLVVMLHFGGLAMISSQLSRHIHNHADQLLGRTPGQQVEGYRPDVDPFLNLTTNTDAGRAGHSSHARLSGHPVSMK